MSRFNFKLIFSILGLLLSINGVAMLLALPFTLYYGEDWRPIVYSAAITVFAGLPVWLILSKKTHRELKRRDGYLVVSFGWIIMSFFGALPFILSGVIPDLTNAFFETISGFTTTGATVLTDIEAVPKGILLWRSLTQWIGGMGIIVLAVAILPILGIGGMQLFVAEAPGISPDKLKPRIKDTAKRLWIIYVGLTGLEAILLMFGGMNFFDAINHSLTTMATGGFSTKNDSIAGFAPYTQYIIMIFMTLAGINFTLHYLALHRKFTKVWENQEFKTYISIIVVIGLLITLGLVFFMDTGIEKAFRNAMFTVISILTTTGFVTTDYYVWPVFLWIMIFALMFVGGSAGSTGGGMKIVRHLLLIKNSWLELKRALHPNAIILVKFNGKAVSQNIIFNVMAFFLIYVTVFAFGTILLSLMGYDFETSVGGAIASLGNIGPGIGGVGPIENYGFFSIPAKWFLSFLMLLGRLELFTILIVLSPAFWKQ